MKIQTFMLSILLFHSLLFFVILLLIPVIFIINILFDHKIEKSSLTLETKISDFRIPKLLLKIFLYC